MKDAGKFLLVAVQLGLILLAIRLYHIEEVSGFAGIAPWIFAAFLIHAFLPLALRMPRQERRRFIVNYESGLYAMTSGVPFARRRRRLRANLPLPISSIIGQPSVLLAHRLSSSHNSPRKHFKSARPFGQTGKNKRVNSRLGAATRAAAEHTEPGAVGMIELDCSRGRAKRSPHLETRVIREQRAGNDHRVIFALSFHNHA